MAETVAAFFSVVGLIVVLVLIAGPIGVWWLSGGKRVR